jgi:hypothetical protein
LKARKKLFRGREVLAQAFRRLHGLYAACEQEIFGHQDMEPCVLGAAPIKFVAEVIYASGQKLAVAAEMLAERLFGEFRGQVLRDGKALGEPSEAALIAQIEMQPKPAVARGGFKVGLREGSWCSICAKAIGADEAPVWCGPVGLLQHRLRESDAANLSLVAFDAEV